MQEYDPTFLLLRHILSTLLQFFYLFRQHKQGRNRYKIPDKLLDLQVV